MKIDVPQMLGAVTREVTEVEREGRPATVVRASRHYDTPPEDVWDALTNPERIPRWFMPVSGELRLGGRYQLHGNAGGEVRRCEPPSLLAVTWEMSGEVSWLEVRLAAEAGGTRLTLEHTAHVSEERQTQYGPGAVGVGWDLALIGLQRYLSTGAAMDPSEAEAWSLSDEGKAFARGSSDDWCRAFIASGAEPALAKAAASRTTAFYTGEAAG